MAQSDCLILPLSLPGGHRNLTVSVNAAMGAFHYTN